MRRATRLMRLNLQWKAVLPSGRVANSCKRGMELSGALFEWVIGSLGMIISHSPLMSDSVLALEGDTDSFAAFILEQCWYCVVGFECRLIGDWYGGKELNTRSTHIYIHA